MTMGANQGSVNRVCLLGLGEAGSRLASDMAGQIGLGSNIEFIAWDRQFDDPASRASSNTKRLPSLRLAKSAEQAAQGCDLVISAVTAAEDMNAARSILPGLESGAWFFDVNSAAPTTRCEVAETVEATGGRYVEGAIMAPIVPKGIASPVLLGGPHAKAFLPIAQCLGFEGASWCSDVLGHAAATKLYRSVIVKGLEALVIEALVGARHHGVEAGVLDSLGNLLVEDNWPDRARYLISRSLQHGVRRSEEMQEAALTVAEAGLRPLMSEACAQQQLWAAGYSGALVSRDLGAILDEVLAGIHSKREAALTV